MIYIDDNYPEETLEPSFPRRDVTIKRNVDAKQYFELISEIGRGKFGTVYKCKELSTGLKLAAKFVPIPKREDRRNVEREVEIMNSLQHPLIIQLYAAYEYQKMMCVVLELIEGGELFNRVVDDDFVLTERVCTVFMRQVCEAMQFIHLNNILHLDLKPENILCLTKEGNRIKVIDFGLARKYDPDKKLQILFGTPEFVAPEVVNFDCISYGTDMWSVGVICYVLLSGLSPFMGETDIETMANVTIAKYDFDDEAFSNVSSEALDFISKLLIKDMSSRMSASECLEHKWLERCSKPASTKPIKNIIEKSETIMKNPVKIIKDIPKYIATPPSPPPELQEQPSAISQPQTILKTPPITTQIPEDQQKQPQSTPSSKKKEILEQTKDNLKTFIERWEEHPNSPYVFDTESYLIAPIHPLVEGLNNNNNNNNNNSTRTSSKGGNSNVSSRACSPSPCESIHSYSDEQSSQSSESLKTKEIMNNNQRLNKDKLTIKDYLQSFDRRNSDTNFLLGRRPSGETRINLAEEIRKLSDHLLMLAEINTKLGKDNEKDETNNNKQQTSSNTEKLETIQESIALNNEINDKYTSINSIKFKTKPNTKRSTSVKDSTNSSSTNSQLNDSSIDFSSQKYLTTTSKSSSQTKLSEKPTKISSLSVRLQQSLDETSKIDSTSLSSSTATELSKNKSISSNEERAKKLTNGFKQQLLLASSSSSLTVGSGVPWPITNKRTKFRINQMSRDVPIGSPDTHQPIDLEDAANTTKDCLLHLLEKYHERKTFPNNNTNSSNSGRHQSISVDWNNISDNLEYQSISSINAFFRRHSSKGNYVKQLQAQLEAKTKKNI